MTFTSTMKAVALVWFATSKPVGGAFGLGARLMGLWLYLTEVDQPGTHWRYTAPRRWTLSEFPGHSTAAGARRWASERAAAGPDTPIWRRDCAGLWLERCHRTTPSALFSHSGKEEHAFYRLACRT